MSKTQTLPPRSSLTEKLGEGSLGRHIHQQTRWRQGAQGVQADHGECLPGGGERVALCF